MSVTIKDLDIGKNEVEFAGFMSLILSKYEQIEDSLFLKILKDSDTEEDLSMDDFNNYSNNRQKGN